MSHTPGPWSYEEPDEVCRMPKFNVEVKLIVKALFTQQAIIEVEAESREVAEEHVREFLDEFKFAFKDYETMEIDTLDILSIEEAK